MSTSVQKKRKQTQKAREHRELESAAHQKKEFMRQLLRIVKALNLEDIYKLLSVTDRELLYHIRARTVRVECEPGGTVSPKVLDDIRKNISQSIKHVKTSIVPDGEKVSLEDYFTAGITLKTYACFVLPECTIEDDFFYFKDEFIRKLMPIDDFSKFDEPIVLLELTGLLMARFHSRPDSRIYYATCGVHQDSQQKYINSRCLYFKSCECKEVVLEIDGRKRPCHALGWPLIDGTVAWGTVSGKTLGINGSLAGLKLDMFIQSHALLRLRERIDVGPESDLYLSFYQSVEFPKYHILKPGTALLEYRILDIILGYFVVEAIDGIALVRTFLFVTSSGTPEGDKIDQILGSCKIDKVYLGLDKLSTFFITDTAKSTMFRDVLKKANCEYLLLVSEYGAYMLKHQQTGNAGYLDRYFGHI